MSDVKLREALESLHQKFTSGNDVPVTEARITRAEYEALVQPTEAVDLTDEECLIVMHAATSKALPEDERVPIEDILSSYRLKLRGASALLSGLRAVIAAHEAKRRQS